jgi:hypothetical protein
MAYLSDGQDENVPEDEGDSVASNIAKVGVDVDGGSHVSVVQVVGGLRVVSDSSSVGILGEDDSLRSGGQVVSERNESAFAPARRKQCSPRERKRTRGLTACWGVEHTQEP